MSRHFTHLKDFEGEELRQLVDHAIALKNSPRTDAPLAGKQVGLCFQNPSLRTRVSMEIATSSMGGHPLFLSLGADTWQLASGDGEVMDGAAAEHVKEAIPVLGRYCDILALRAFPGGESWEQDRAEPVLSAFREHAGVPIVNMESATGHPLQALADLMTVTERMPPPGKNFLLTWAPHPKGLPMAVPSSAAEVAAMAGMNVTIARPQGFDLPPEVMERIEGQCNKHGTTVTVTNDPQVAYQGAHVVYAKSWMSMDRYGQSPPQDAEFQAKWRVDQDKIESSADAIFMHCLPVRRNVVVTDSVIDGPWSVVIDQAENRLHTAKAVLLHLLGEL